MNRFAAFNTSKNNNMNRSTKNTTASSEKKPAETEQGWTVVIHRKPPKSQRNNNTLVPIPVKAEPKDSKKPASSSQPAYQKLTYAPEKGERLLMMSKTYVVKGYMIVEEEG